MKTKQVFQVVLILLCLGYIGYRVMYGCPFSQCDRKPVPKTKALVTKPVITEEHTIKTEVLLAPEYDVGFHVAAHLYLPDVAITLYDKKYVEEIKEFRKEHKLPETRLNGAAEELSKKLNEHWMLHRITRVPTLFDNFNDTKIALRILVGDEDGSPANEKIFNRIKWFKNKFSNLSEEQNKILRELAALIVEEYEKFYVEYYKFNKEKFVKAKEAFAQKWAEEMEPALKLIDHNNSIRDVRIILSPALRRHGKSFGVKNGLGKVANLLPVNDLEMDDALFYTLHEMTHGITDQYVYDLGYDQKKKSFKEGDEGKFIHNLTEDTVNYTLYQSLKHKDPLLADRFVATGIGDLSWLSQGSRFEERVKVAGHDLSEEIVADVKTGLQNNAKQYSKQIYDKGWLVPAAIQHRVKKILAAKK